MFLLLSSRRKERDYCLNLKALKQLVSVVTYPAAAASFSGDPVNLTA